jgi:hypothetical protein
MGHRPPPVDSTESFGCDSFLDVVSNMVGILVILLMVVGLRAKNAVDTPVPPEQTAAETKALQNVAARRSEAGILQKDVEKVFAKAKELTDLALQRLDERNALAEFAAVKRHEFETQKAKLDDATRAAFELQQEAAAEKVKLASLEEELNAAEADPKKESIKVKAYPTPMSRTVHGREAHFQLKNGRIVYVPLEELCGEVKREMQRRASNLRDMNQFNDVVGPIGGFRLKYSVEGVNVPPQHGQPGGRFIGVTQLQFQPLGDNLGETQAEAMRPDSDLQRALADLDARRITITFWTYPDSFDLYRKLREHLYERGYAVAGRPLQMNQPISGSPFGTKSAAQ